MSPQVDRTCKNDRVHFSCVTHHVGHIIDAGTLPVGGVGVLGDELVFVGLHHASVQLLLQPVLGGAPPSATERQKWEEMLVNFTFTVSVLAQMVKFTNDGLIHINTT